MIKLITVRNAERLIESVSHKNFQRLMVNNVYKQCQARLASRVEEEVTVVRQR